MANSIKLEIPTPCHEDWDKMTPEQHGRFCGSCQKPVIDFTMMSDKEVLVYFAKTKGNICGRFANDQLERDLAQHKSTNRNKWAFTLNLLVPAFLVSGKAFSQGSPRVKACTEKVYKNGFLPNPVGQRSDTISPMGVVVDDITGKPISGATVSWLGSSLIYNTDDRGEFSMCAAPVGENKLEISSIGYETAIVNAPFLGRHVTYRLKQQYKELEPVIVTGFGSRITQGLTYTVISKKRCDRMIKNEYSILNKVKDSIQLVAFKKSIKLYPNPIEPGSKFFFDFNSNAQGIYKVEIIDAAGRILQTEQINIVFKKQTISLFTASHWAKGMYWVRLIGRENNNVYTGKLVIR